MTEEANRSGLTRYWQSDSGRLPFIAVVFGSIVVWLAWIQWPSPAATDLDASAQLVLGYAHEQGWQFGPGIIFTHGPWSFLKLVYCYPPNFWPQIASRVVFLGMVASTVGFLAWKLPIWRAVLLFAGAALLLPLFEDVAPFLMVIFVFFCGVRSRASLWLLLIAAPVLALLSLQKLTYLAMASVAATATTLLLLLAGRRRDAAIFPSLIIGSLCVLWIAAGQRLGALPAFVSRSWQIGSVYSEAMFLDETPGTFLCGMLVLLIAGIVLARSIWKHELSPQRRLVIAATAAAFGFILWKHAFVRADGHVQGLFLCALGIGLALPQSIGGLALCAAALLGFAVSSPKLLSISPALLRFHLETSFRALSSPVEFHASFLKETAAAEHAARLPNIALRVRNAALDVFGNEPAIAVLNHFSYQPRPVFQSYEACSAALDAINADYYASPDAPRFVLFRPRTVDNRFFSSDDAYLLIQLLQNYRCVVEENGWCLLEQQQVCSTPSFQEVATVKSSLGRSISVPQLADSFITVQIHIQPSALGRLRALLYKPAKLTLTVDDGLTHQRYRLVAPAASAGFLINPLMRNGDDYRDFCQHRQHTPRTVVLDVAPSARKFYQPEVSMTFSRPKLLDAEAPHSTNVSESNRPTKVSGSENSDSYAKFNQ